MRRGPGAAPRRVAALVAALGGLAALAPPGAVAAATVPGFDAVRVAHAPSDIPVLDRQGMPLQWVRVDSRVRRGPWIGLSDISPALRQAIVLTEDRRFWDHGGVDWRALAAGAWAHAWNNRTRGASTLTMQLAGLLDAGLARPAGGRGLGQKLTQIWRAEQLEGRWTKAQILEAYLNEVPLRGELVGVAAASDGLFGKHPSGLDAQEAALLAAMVRAPNAQAAQVERRACEVLRAQQLDCAGLATTLAQALVRRPGPWGLRNGESLAPHLAGHLLARWQGLSPGSTAPTELRTTLDAGVQRMALAALRRQLAELRGRDVEDGAVVVLDNASGEVRAWVGSSGPVSAAAEVDAVLARRQPGSTIKPFVYALALQQRLITAGSLLDDAPLQLAAGTALYQPQNYDHAYKGWVPARTALASSLNVPAVRVAALLGPEALFEGLNRAGLRLAETAGYHGHALALGSADVTLLDLTNAYRTLANGGLAGAVRWQPEAAGARRVAPVRLFQPEVAFVVADILADPAARALTFGLDSPLVTRGWAAVKTGTSKDLRDNWCLGFTDRYTVGVWVGNASGAPMHAVSGMSGAAPVWHELVAHLQGQHPSQPPEAPAGLRRAAGEWYLAGTEPAPGPATAPRAGPQAFGIQSPLEGTVVVLDPDIPRQAQQLVFEGAPGYWSLDGQALGTGARIPWLPRPGTHVVEWRDPGGTGRDRVAFEVRAGPPAPSLRRRPG